MNSDDISSIELESIPEVDKIDVNLKEISSISSFLVLENIETKETVNSESIYYLKEKLSANLARLQEELDKISAKSKHSTMHDVSLKFSEVQKKFKSVNGRYRKSEENIYNKIEENIQLKSKISELILEDGRIANNSSACCCNIF